MSIRHWLAAVLIAAAASAPAAEHDDALTADDTVAVAYSEYRDAAVARLAARGDDAATVAAVLMLGMEYHGMVGADGPLARELIAGIDVTRSTSPMALLRLLDDRLLPEDERAAAVERLLDIDRGNAAAWVHAVELAVARGADAETIDALLAEAAASARTYATHLDTTMRTIFRAFRAVPMPDALHATAMAGVDTVDSVLEPADRLAAGVAATIASAVATPHAIRRECDRLQVPDWHRRSAACLALAQTMARHADTVLAELLSHALWRSAGGDDAAIAEQYRAAKWRAMAYAELAMSDPHRDLDVVEFVARMNSDDRTEIDGIAYVLRREGIALQPPADWQPPR